MLKIVSLVTTATALAVAGAAVAVALAGPTSSTYTFRSAMGTAAEVPKPKGAPAAAKGLFTATMTEGANARTLRWKLTFSKLSGKAVASHVHRGKAGVAGGVLVALCGPCTSGQTGTTKLSRDVADAFEHGRLYVNVHTARNPGGEIRGQLKLVKHVGETPATSPTTTGETTTTSPDDDGGRGAY